MPHKTAKLTTSKTFEKLQIHSKINNVHPLHNDSALLKLQGSRFIQGVTC